MIEALLLLYAASVLATGQSLIKFARDRQSDFMPHTPAWMRIATSTAFVFAMSIVMPLLVLAGIIAGFIAPFRDVDR